MPPWGKSAHSMAPPRRRRGKATAQKTLATNVGLRLRCWRYGLPLQGDQLLMATHSIGKLLANSPQPTWLRRCGLLPSACSWGHAKISSAGSTDIWTRATSGPRSSPRTTPMMTRPRLLPRAPSGFADLALAHGQALRFLAGSFHGAAPGRREAGVVTRFHRIMANFLCWKDGASIPRA